MAECVRAHFVFGGRVQGVGFRYAVQQAALSMQVAGWVRNEPDGRVTCELEGSSDAVERVLLILVQEEQSGRAWHRLLVEERSSLAPTGQSGFTIKR